MNIKNLIDLLKIWKQLGFSSFLGALGGIFKKGPLQVRLGEGKYQVNSEQTAIFHLANSVSKLERLVAAIPPAEAPVILDVGANCGLFSVLAAQRFPGAQIYAFEPAAELAGLASENLARHGGIVVPKAVTDKSGEVTLYVNADSQQTNSLFREAVEAVGALSAAEQVAAISLDDFASSNDLGPIDLLKIDVQGAESLVLAGASQVLENTRALIVEVSFLDPNAPFLMQSLAEQFPAWQPVNSVLYGADILFTRNAE